MADDNQLINVKVDPTGGFGLAVSGNLPDLIYKVLPAKFRHKRDIDEALHKGIVEKIGKNSELSEQEKEFIQDIVSDRAAKVLRLNRVLAQSCEIVAKKQRLSLTASPDKDSGIKSDTPADSETPKTTTSDWVSRFKEDASLVDEETIQTIYAHILAEEATKPGSFSLRTLAVLRSLDRETAEAFRKLKGVVINHRAVPSFDIDAKRLYKSIGLEYVEMIVLQDAGLVSPTQTDFSQGKLGAPGIVLSGQKRYAYDKRIFNVVDVISFSPVNLLTPAGFQLCKVAESDYSEQTVNLLIEWIVRQNGSFHPDVIEFGQDGQPIDQSDPAWTSI